MADNKDLKKDVETKEEKKVPIAEEKNEIKETENIQLLTPSYKIY